MKLSNTVVLILILLVGIILRFFNYFEIPFTHDELSALFRLNFDTFPELIDKGVKIDGHPAGVHVFLYYWTKLFGTGEWVMKLPFTIMGIGSIYLVYLIGRKWFNETVGLIAAAYLASIQFTVMYSQIARPYISGMFFALMMVNFWSNLVFSPDKRFIRNAALFILSTALCTYNHHFGLLFAVIVGLSGFFFIRRKYLARYLVCGVLVFVLYIPHLKIFFYQLHVGGVEGWLGKPHNDFLLEFIGYIFHYSVFTIGVAGAIIIYGFFSLKREGAINGKLIVLSLAWFLIPFLIGFFYSRYISAVLQFSVLIFSFPFLFFVLFGIMKNQTAKANLALVSVILISNVLTLIYTRKHYSIFYTSAYEHVLLDYDKLRKDGGNTVYLVDARKDIIDYYRSKLKIDSGFVDYSATFPDWIAFKNYLERVEDANDQLFLGCVSGLSPNVVSLVLDYFPTIKTQNNYFGGTSYLFAKGPDTTGKIIEHLDFDSSIPAAWTGVDSSSVVADDSTSNHVYHMTNDVEWGPKFSIPLREVMTNENDFIDISVNIKPQDSLDGIVVVASLDSKPGNIYWGGNELKEYVSAPGDREWTRIHHSVKLSDIYLKRRSIILNIYVWNKGKRNFLVDDFRIVLRKGNPVIYGLYEPF